MLCIIFFSTSTPGGDQHHSVRSREEENVGNDDDVGNADIKTRQEISVNVVIVGGTEAEAQHR